MEQTTEAYVVDASVTVKWLLTDEVLSDEALAMWRRQNEGVCRLVAPAHIHCDVSNAIAFAVRHNPPRLSINDGRVLIERFLRLRLATVPANELVIAAYDLVNEYGVSIYDALYLALTVEYGIPLITADAKFYRRVADRTDVHWLGDCLAE